VKGVDDFVCQYRCVNTADYKTPTFLRVGAINQG